LSKDNAQIAADVAGSISAFYDGGAVLVVSNPVDLMTKLFTERLALPAGCVFGTGCALDASRLVALLSDRLGVPSNAISAHVVGEHGDKAVVLWDSVMVNELPIEDYCAASGGAFAGSDKRQIEKSLHSMGTQIIAGKGKTQFGIAVCACEIAEAVMGNSKKVFCVSCVGSSGNAYSMPRLVGSAGVVGQIPTPKPQFGRMDL
jgi:L-lactate dehydrogenase